MANQIEVRVNGEPRRVVAATLDRVLTELGYAVDEAGIAVAVNGDVIPRGRWVERGLSDGDELDVVGAVQGG